ncbi:hypothetical protein MHBO_000740 [Bonamia ostreae]|uniref:Sm domain-containing protein n=1 Tax=Bonamia ostreae TaxID=126728 RepID=A0ABV2AGS0_9EUKA
MSNTVIAPSNLVPSKNANALAGAKSDPFELILMSLDEVIYVKCRNDVELKGKLHSYDEHLNIILEDVVETKAKKEFDVSVGEAILRKDIRRMDMLFVRGDAVMMISPPRRTK